MSTAIRNQYVTAALKAQRSILSGELKQLENQTALKAEALAHVDAVLAMYAPEIDAQALPVRRPRGENPYPVPNASRRILGILRRRGEPMSAPDVVEALVAEMGFGPEATATVAHFTRFRLRDLARGPNASVLKEGWRAEAMWSIRRD